MAKTLLAVVFLSVNLLHFPQGPARARRLVEALLVVCRFELYYGWKWSPPLRYP